MNLVTWCIDCVLPMRLGKTGRLQCPRCNRTIPPGTSGGWWWHDSRLARVYNIDMSTQLYCAEVSMSRPSAGEGRFPEVVRGEIAPNAVQQWSPDNPVTRPISAMAIDPNVLFFLEFMAAPEERAFLAALHANPDDAAVRGQYVDWLLERGRLLSAEQVRGGWTPGMLPKMQ